jgi:hypothetical protein
MKLCEFKLHSESYLHSGGRVAKAKRILEKSRSLNPMWNSEDEMGFVNCSSAVVLNV